MSFMNSMNGDVELPRGADARRYLFALELRADSQSEFRWTPESALEKYTNIPEIHPDRNEILRHSLVLRRAIVGPSAKENESNLISVEVMDPEVNGKSSFPLVYLSKGKESQALIDFSFPEIEDIGVTFTLKGAGPVHLIGYHFIERVPGDYGEADEEEVGEEEEEDDEMSPEAVQKVKPVIKGKRHLLDDVEESVVTPKKGKGKGKANGSGAAKNGTVENEPEPVQAAADK